MTGMAIFIKYACQESIQPFTVEPLLSGHPWGMARWPFNRGGRLIEVCPILTRIWSNFLVFTFKSLFIMYKSKMSISMKNSLKRKTVPEKTKKIFQILIKTKRLTHAI